MRHRRLHRCAGRRPDPPRGAGTAGVPRLRLRGCRGRHQERPQDPQVAGPGGRPRRRAARPVQGGAGHRAHALGDPRRADRGQRAPAHGRRRPDRRRAQRDHRERGRAARQADRRRRRVPLADRHRGRAPSDRRGLRGRRPRPRARGQPGAAQRGGRLRHRRSRRRAPGPDRRRPQRQPRAAGDRRARDVRRLRRRRPRRLHPPGRLPRRRRARDDHDRRLPDLHPGRPVDGQEPGDDRLGHHRRRDRRPRPLPPEGDRRAAADHRADAARPARRPVLHRAPRRAQPVGARGPRVQARQDPRLRLGLLRR